LFSSFFPGVNGRGVPYTISVGDRLCESLISCTDPAATPGRYSMDAPAHGNDQKGAEKVGGNTVAASNTASNPSSLSAEYSLAPEKSEPLSVASLGDVKIPIFQSRESTSEDRDFASDLERIPLDHDTEPIDEDAPTEFSTKKHNLSMPP
jgi:hypothetical protein